jgi:hypothetical protein
MLGRIVPSRCLEATKICVIASGAVSWFPLLFAGVALVRLKDPFNQIPSVAIW